LPLIKGIDFFMEVFLMFLRVLFIGLALLSFAAVSGSAAVINHDSIDALASVPQGVMDFVGEQKWFFSHASVGSNMVDGMNSLHSTTPARYKLSVLGDDGTPPATTTAGTVYEYPRGNPDWTAKITQFDSYVDAGWRSPMVQFAMDKFCYIDQGANATTYLNSMAALEFAYPTTKLVYCTMPLMTSTDSDNILRNNFNNAVRTYCINNNKLLYDIADMEAHDLSGNELTFTSGGKTYQKLYSGYSSDGGHLNSTGAQQIAKGWYATCVYGTRYVTFNENWGGGTSSAWATAGNWTTTDGNVIVPDAPGITVTLGRTGARSTLDLAATGRTLGGLTFQANVPTTISGAAALTLDNNDKTTTITAAGTHTISAGLFFEDDLQIGGGGTLNISGSFGGAASKTLTVMSGTTVNLNGAANNIANSIVVLGQLNATSLHVPSLTIGNNHAASVPEPSSLALLLIGAMGAAWCIRRK
jgi:hypothetical protein